MKKTSLTDIAYEFRDLYEPRESESLPYVGLEHIQPYALHLSGLDDSANAQSTKKRFRREDILFGTLRPYFRKVVRAKFDGVCSTDIAVIRAKEPIDTGFLFYLIASQPFIDYATATASGTRMPRAKWSILNQMDWGIPPQKKRAKIASILSAYDDLIENNSRRINILEDMAAAIYRQWFVEFRFPGHETVPMVESELDLIPQGWEVVKTEQIVNRVPSGKKYNQKTVNQTGSVPVLDQGRSGIIGYHNDVPGVIASEDDPIIVFANHTCYQRIIQFPFSAIQNVLPFLPHPEKYRSIYWLHWATKDLVDLNDYKGHWPEFMTKELLLPTSSTCQQFGEHIKPMVQLSHSLDKQNENLRQSRDLLLPKLISGEIDVSELNIDTEVI